MNTRREKLEHDLRVSIKRAERGSSAAFSLTGAAKILKALQKFLIEWDALVGEDFGSNMESSEAEDIKSFPVDFVRQVFCRILAILDPINDADLVREHLLLTLRSVEKDPCRQILFDFLPSVTMAVDDKNKDQEMMNERKSKKLKRDVKACLRDVFENDKNSLAQILDFFSLTLTMEPPQQCILSKRDALLFIVEILPRIPESHLHIAIQALIRYVDSTEDARVAVDSIRVELALLEKTDISDMVSIAVIFDEAIQGNEGSEEMFVDEYLTVVAEEINDQSLKRKESQNIEAKESDDQLMTFDLIMVILQSFGSRNYQRILDLIGDLSLIYSGLLSQPNLEKLMELVDENENMEAYLFPTSTPRERIIGAMMDFFIGMILVPLRYTMDVDPREYYSEANPQIIAILSVLPKRFKMKAISDVFDVLEKLLKPNNEDSTITRSIDGKQLRESRKTQRETCDAIFVLLRSIASTQREVLVPFKSRIVEIITTSPFDHSQEGDFLAQICVILANLVNVENPCEKLDFLCICRALLFSASRSGKTSNHARPSGQLTQDRSRGMILLNAFVSSQDFDEALLATMRKMVSRVLLSQYSDIPASEPKVCLYGMRVIGSIRVQKECGLTFRKEMFETMSKMLSFSRVVLYPDDSSKLKSGNRKNSILAYADVPKFAYEAQLAKPRKFRKMIFCFESFLADGIISSGPRNLDVSTIMMFELIDTYLALGRSSKWNPRAWIFGGISLPVLASTTPVTKSRERKLLEWMKSDLNSVHFSSSSAASLASSMAKEIADLIKRGKTILEKEALLESTHRFSLALLFALSCSIAILRNAYDHFQPLLEKICTDVDLEEKEEAIFMIQYQFLKVYDLKRRLKSIERVLRNLWPTGRRIAHKRSKRRKVTKSNKETSYLNEHDAQVDLDVAANRIRKTLEKVFHSVRYIPSNALWMCLTEPTQDALVASFIGDYQGSKEETELRNILPILSLRVDLIDNLVLTWTAPSYPERTDFRSTPGTNIKGCESYLSKFLRMASFLLLKIPIVSKNVINGTFCEALTILTSKYFNLMCTMMASTTELSDASATKDSDFKYLASLLLSILRMKEPMNSTVEHQLVSAVELDTFLPLFRNCTRHNHGLLTHQLLETLSIVASELESCDTQELLEFHWKATFLSSYSYSLGQTTDTHYPFVLTKVLKLLHDSPNERHGYQIVMKLMKNRFHKFGERNFFFVHSICRHWALIGLSREKLSLFVTFHCALSQKLSGYLNDINDNADETDNYEDVKQETSLDEEDDGDGDYIPPSSNRFKVLKPSIPPCENFVALTSSTYPVLFDMLLRTLVSSVALFSVPKAMSNFRVAETTSNRDNPMYVLERLVQVYGSLIELYRRSFRIFPKFVLSTVMNASKCLLELSVSKVQEYIDWRNNQPLPPPEKVDQNRFDPASVNFLKKVLDLIGVHVIGSLRCLQTALPDLKNPLDRKIERVFSLLSKTSQVYKTGDIILSKSALDVEEVERVRRKTSKHYLSKALDVARGSSSPKRLSAEQNILAVKLIDPSLIRKRRPDRESPPSRLLFDRNEIGGSETEDNVCEEAGEFSSSGSEFGVTGDWGQNNDDHSDSYDDGSEFVVDRFDKSR